MFATTFLILASALGLFYLYLRNKNEYWAKRGLITPKPLPLLGNYADYILLRKNFADTVTAICEQFPEEPMIGAYFGTEPVVIVKDPELLKLVMTKDFYYFSSRELGTHTKREAFTKNLFTEQGDNWRVLRQNLTPIFTSAKMKKMFYLIQERTQDFEIFLENKVTSNTTQDVRTLMARYTMDCIGSCIFGVESKVMKEENNNPFVAISEKIFDFAPHKVFKTVLRALWPSIFYMLRLEVFDPEVENFFKRLVEGVFLDRKHAPGSRHDFIDFILGFKKNSYIVGDDIKSMKDGSKEKQRVKLDIDDDILVAQTTVFFAAGFEASAATMSFTLFELAKHPKVQARVCAEVDAYLKSTGGEVTFECLTSLPLLEACVDETQRLYPVLGALTREVVEEYRLPVGPRLARGTRVHVPVHYLHKHPDYFPDPEQFRPERFLPENKHNIVPYTYFPFGEGPRICIGMRYAMMQMMPGLVTVLRHYTVELPPHVSRDVDSHPLAFALQPKHMIELDFVPRTNNVK